MEIPEFVFVHIEQNWTLINRLLQTGDFYSKHNWIDKLLNRLALELSQNGTTVA